MARPWRRKRGCSGLQHAESALSRLCRLAACRWAEALDATEQLFAQCVSYHELVLILSCNNFGGYRVHHPLLALGDHAPLPDLQSIVHKLWMRRLRIDVNGSERFETLLLSSALGITLPSRRILQTVNLHEAHRPQAAQINLTDHGWIPHLSQ